MIKKEQVKIGLQCIIDGTVRCESCGYAIDKHGHHSCQQECAKDAISLLKEQEAKSVESIQIDRSDKWGADLTGYCPSCKRPLKNRFNTRFCGECGQEVTWDG